MCSKATIISTALIDCEIHSNLTVQSQVRLKVEINGNEYEEGGTGNGGYDAFIAALTNILGSIGFTMPELVDYSVRIPKGGKPGALTECTITWAGQPRNLRTRGVHANQVYAAVLATLRMVNTHLHAQSTVV